MAHSSRRHELEIKAPAKRPPRASFHAAPKVERLAYTVKQSAEALGVGKTTLYELFKNGALKPIRIGGRTLVPASELHRLIAEAEAAL